MGIFSTIKDQAVAKSTATQASAATPAPAAAPVMTITAGEVEAIIEAKVKAKGKPSNWRVSIVDLLSALDLDSSLASRKELAVKLKYSGTDADGSAEKNTWLHKAVMEALAGNGGNVPDAWKK